MYILTQLRKGEKKPGDFAHEVGFFSPTFRLQNPFCLKYFD